MTELGTYNGGKGQIFRQLINQMPPHDIYIAAFAGSDAVALNKRPAKLNILIDKDEDVIASWAGYLAGDTAIAGGAAAPLGMTMPAVAAATVRVDGSTWWLIAGDSLKILPDLVAGLGPGTRTLIYADPPYLLSARSNQRSLYKHEMGDDEDHRQLIALLRALPCKIMLSGYCSELYDGLLHDWRSSRFRAVARSGRPVWEYIWCNYPEPVQLHDYAFLGENYRERERIRRKAGRWVGRFQSLPVLERRAIIHELEGAGIL